MAKLPEALRAVRRSGAAPTSQRVVLITGAGRGVGRATAKELARRGMKVILCSRTRSELDRVAEEIRRSGGACDFFTADLAREGQIAGLCEAVWNAHGHVDVLINNAALFHYGAVEYTSSADWDALMNTNLRAPFLLVKHLVPAMVRAGGGTIVNVASGAGLQGMGNLSLYCASKFGLVGLSESLRKELAPKGVRVCCVCPSFINTTFCEASHPGFPAPRWRLEPEEVASAIASLLCSRRPRTRLVMHSPHRVLSRIQNLFSALPRRGRRT